MREMKIKATSCYDCPMSVFSPIKCAFCSYYGEHKLIDENIENKTFHRDCPMKEVVGNKENYVSSKPLEYSDSSFGGSGNVKFL